MSKVKITGNASGSGVFTLTTPNTSTDRTITLPDGTGTLAFTTGDDDKLPLAGGTMTGILATNSQVNFTVASGGGNFIGINHTGNEAWTLDARSGTGSDDYLSVGISGGARAMSWHETGKVGIGTTAPQRTLHVKPSTNEDTGVLAETHSAGDAMSIYSKGSSSHNWATGLDNDGSGGNGFSIAYKANGYPSLSSNSRVTIHTTGQMVVPSGVRIGGDTTANTLDDYEIGTWTPTITCSSSGSYTLDTGANLAAYTKTGRVVHIQGGISVASQNSPSGAIRMSLPFTAFTSAKDTDYSLGSCTIDGAGGTIDNGIHIFAFGTSYVQFPLVSDSGSFSYLANGNVDSAWALKFSFSYIAA